MWLFSKKGSSGFTASSTAEEVTRGIDGTGLTAVVTGATSGIGAETARVLALRGVHVVMGIRDIKAGRQIKEAMMRDNSKAKIDVMELDLTSMESVRNFATQFNSCGLPLNILINNAGIMATPFKLSKDNIELQFATNHIGLENPGNGGLYYHVDMMEDFGCHFLLTNLLLDTMKQTATEHRKEGRIVNVSSRRHRFSYPGGIRFNKINEKSGYNNLSAYGQSKLANVLHTNELARRLKEDGADITANSLHPGAIATNLFRHYRLIDGLVGLLGKYVMKNIQQVKGMSGCYFADCNVAGTSSQASDPDLATKLWDYSSDLVQSRFKVPKY